MSLGEYSINMEFKSEEHSLGALRRTPSKLVCETFYA
jgi:hypothetical protein